MLWISAIVVIRKAALMQTTMKDPAKLMIWETELMMTVNNI